MQALIELQRLTVEFPRDARGPGIVVRDVSLSVFPGERIAIVGESGSGKSLTALACLGLVPEPGRITHGRVLIDGGDLGTVPAADLRRWRSRTVGFSFQDASSALNPVYTIRYQLEEAVRSDRHVDRAESRGVAHALLEMVAVDSIDRILASYPHQLSGGQAQRVMLALALAGEPRLLIADEPTSSLDVVTRIAILRLLDRLVRERGLALLLISHDLNIVRHAVDRVMVMYAGEIVEESPTEALFREPLHPYTRLLLGSATGNRDRHTDPRPPRTSVQNGTDSRGCQFAPRCGEVRPGCRANRPDLACITDDRKLRCPVVAENREDTRVER